MGIFGIFFEKIFKIANEKTRENERKNEILRDLTSLNHFESKKFVKRA